MRTVYSSMYALTPACFIFCSRYNEPWAHLQVYRPRNTKPSDKLPILVWIHASLEVHFIVVLY